MKTNLRLVAVATFVLASLVFAKGSIYSSEDLESKKGEIEQLQKELEKVRGQKQTLSSTISYLDTQINLTESEIDGTELELGEVEKDIDDLSGKIQVLDRSLEDITGLLVERIKNSYKQSRVNPLLQTIADSQVQQNLSAYKYLLEAQKNDRAIIYQMEATKVTFDNQKKLKEEKQAELDALTDKLQSQKVALDRQQQEKQSLLQVTKNDEARFQSELAQKQAELEAIQSIIAGKGDETEVGGVNTGDKIATVIAGPSTCSSGAHLHFEVAQSGVHKNPASYLSGRSVNWDNAPDGSFDFTGSWAWPLNDPVRITQGYGMTFYASTMRYYGGAPHTGIDMVNNSDYTVKSVDSGTLFRGAIGCRGGTLRYVRVQHSDTLSSFYLHVNY